MENKYYLYRHIRLDKNEPFYIGIGAKQYRYKRFKTIKNEYARAYSKTRSTFWKAIAAKSDYEIEILFESNDYEFIKQKEIEFIALYGRYNIGKGPLCNLTDGGDYNVHAGKFEEASIFSKKVYQYDFEGNFIQEYCSRRKAARSLDIDEENIAGAAIRKGSHGGYRWFSNYIGNKIESYKPGFSESKKVPVVKLTLEGSFVAEYDSSISAANGIKGKALCISRCCRGGAHTAFGYKWIYKKEYND